MVKRAACILLVDSIGQILITSRRGSTTQWGLPGGKVDPGEEPIDAAVREMAEETGYILDKEALRPLYQGMCGEYLTDTFFCCGTTVVDRVRPVDDDIITQWAADHTILTSPDTSPFYQYNLNVFK